MKKNIITIILIFLSIISFSQNLCDDAYEINSIPFFEANINTIDADADTSGNYCGASGVAANDTIFAFTPTSDVSIDIILSNVQISYDFLVLMFIYDECPDVAGATCLQSATGGDFVISDVALTAGNTYYIIITNTNALSVSHFIFDLEVREHYQKDLELMYFTQPHSNCQLNSPWQEISADIKNIGNDTVFGYKMRYDINGSIDSLDFTDDTLVPNQQKTIFFYKDLSIEYEYLVKVYIDYPLDQNAENDTISVRVHNLGDINTFPYLEDFEDTTHWIAEWSKYVYDYPFSTAERSSWQWGEPSATVINSAAEGNKAIVSNLTGNCFDYERSVLMSPCFDFTSLTNPVIEFDMWKNLDTITAVYLEYSINDGGSWTRIGATGTGTNWYNEYQGYANDTWLGNSGGWLKAKHRMDNLGGETKVMLRFVLENPSLVTSEGFAIDNIHIFEAPNHDIGVSEILSPQSSCALSHDSIKIVIKNYSPDSSHTNFSVRYVINDVTEVIETVTDVVNANDSLIYTFNTTYDFTNIGEYKIFAETMLTADDDTTNDADSINIINFEQVSTLPYFNDFETDNGNFFAIGENSTWQWGEPTDSVISTAYSGTKIWATNLSGYHNAPENTYLTSSCFDLSNMKRPYIKFKTWYDLYFLDGLTSSYAQVETSLDDGATWSVLGTSADANWYKVGSAWTGTINNWEEMSHALSIEPNIKFRFKLWAMEAKTGIAIDDFEICDAPIAGFDYLALSGEVHFNDTSVNATNYQWLFSDGQSSDLRFPVMTFTEDTVVATLIVTNSCFTDTIKDTILTEVGIRTLSDNDVRIFPNPVKDNLNIVFDKLYGEVYIKITDINSKIIYSQKIENNKTNNTISINLTNFDSGMYFLRITTNNGELVKKILCK